MNNKKAKYYILLMTVVCLTVSLMTASGLSYAKASPNYSGDSIVMENILPLAGDDEKPYFIHDDLKGKYVKEDVGVKTKVRLSMNVSELSYTIDVDHDPAMVNKVNKIAPELILTHKVEGSDNLYYQEYLHTSTLNGDYTFYAKVFVSNDNDSKPIYEMMSNTFYVDKIDYIAPTTQVVDFTYYQGIELRIKVTDHITAQKLSAKSGLKSVKLLNHNDKVFYSQTWNEHTFDQTSIFTAKITEMGTYYVEAEDQAGNVRKTQIYKKDTNFDEDSEWFSVIDEQLTKSDYNSTLKQELSKAYFDYKFLKSDSTTSTEALKDSKQKLTDVQTKFNRAVVDIKVTLLGKELLGDRVNVTVNNENLSAPLKGDNYEIRVTITAYNGNRIDAYDENIRKFADFKINEIIKVTVELFKNGEKELPKIPIKISLGHSGKEKISVSENMYTNTLTKSENITGEWVSVTLDRTDLVFHIIASKEKSAFPIWLIILLSVLGAGLIIASAIIVTIKLKKKPSLNRDSSAKGIKLADNAKDSNIQDTVLDKEIKDSHNSEADNKQATLVSILKKVEVKKKPPKNKSKK